MKTAEHTLPGDNVLGYAELKNDLLFHRIPHSKRRYYVERPLAIGREQALAFKARYGTEVGAICRERGIRVDLNQRKGTIGQIRFRAQIELSAKERVITLYQSSMEELRQSAGVLLPHHSFSLKEITDIHLAHELFHDLEFTELGYTNKRLDDISSLSLGPLRIRSSVTRTSEIAAHAFSRYLLDLPCLPNLLDYAYMIHSGTLTAAEFWRQTGIWSGELEHS